MKILSNARRKMRFTHMFYKKSFEASKMYRYEFTELLKTGKNVKRPRINNFDYRALLLPYTRTEI